MNDRPLRTRLLFNQGPEFNGYLVGRGNVREVDLNRNFPDLNALMYYYEKSNGRNHHLPLPDNWEQQVRRRACPRGGRGKAFNARRHLARYRLESLSVLDRPRPVVSFQSYCGSNGQSGGVCAFHFFSPQLTSIPSSGGTGDPGSHQMDAKLQFCPVCQSPRRRRGGQLPFRQVAGRPHPREDHLRRHPG